MPDAIGHDRRRARRLQGLQLVRPARGEPGRGERAGTHPSTGPGQQIPCRAGPQGAAHAVPVRPPPVDPLRDRARAGVDRPTGEGTAARGTPWGRREGPARLGDAACQRVGLRQVRDAVAASRSTPPSAGTGHSQCASGTPARAASRACCSATRSSIRGPIGSGRSSRVTPGASRPASRRGIPCHARTSRRESLVAIDPGSRALPTLRAPPRPLPTRRAPPRPLPTRRAPPRPLSSAWETVHGWRRCVDRLRAPRPEIPTWPTSSHNSRNRRAAAF